MIETVPHVTSDSGLRKFQAYGFLLDRVDIGSSLYQEQNSSEFHVFSPFIVIKL